jgi:purine-binding chemotaxis protein CheW
LAKALSSPLNCPLLLEVMQASDPLIQHPDTVACLQLQAGQIHCMVELQQVEKIVLLPGLTVVPEAPDYLAGILNYHGSHIPVIDLAIRLGQQIDTPYTVDTITVLVNCPDRSISIGLIVHSTGQVQDILRSDLQLSQQCSDKSLPFTALVNHENDVFFLLNTQILVSSSLYSLNAVTPADLNKLVQTLLNQPTKGQ